MDPLYYQTPDLSPYSFVANNPINLYDVAGLSEDDVAHPGLSLYYNVYYEDWFEDFNDVWDNLYSPEIGGSIAFSFFPGSGGNFLATYPSAKRIREKWEKRTFTGYYNTSIGDPVDADKIDLINEEWGEWDEYEYEAWVKIYEEVDGIGIGAPVILRDFPNWGQYYNYTPWMKTAMNEKGVYEYEGKARNNPRILEYLRTTTYPNPSMDEIPWCSAFVNWCLRQNGYTGTNNAAAESWLNWGQKLNEPKYGAIIVFKAPGVSHVGFYLGTNTNGTYQILGGNQGKPGGVRISNWKTRYIKAIIWLR